MKLGIPTHIWAKPSKGLWLQSRAWPPTFVSRAPSLGRPPGGRKRAPPQSSWGPVSPPPRPHKAPKSPPKQPTRHENQSGPGSVLDAKRPAPSRRAPNWPARLPQNENLPQEARGFVRPPAPFVRPRQRPHPAAGPSQWAKAAQSKAVPPPTERRPRPPPPPPPRAGPPSSSPPRGPQRARKKNIEITANGGPPEIKYPTSPPPFWDKNAQSRHKNRCEQPPPAPGPCLRFFPGPRWCWCPPPSKPTKKQAPPRTQPRPRVSRVAVKPPNVERGIKCPFPLGPAPRQVEQRPPPRPLPPSPRVPAHAVSRARKQTRFAPLSQPVSTKATPHGSALQCQNPPQPPAPGPPIRCPLWGRTSPEGPAGGRFGAQ